MSTLLNGVICKYDKLTFFEVVWYLVEEVSDLIWFGDVKFNSFYSDALVGFQT